MSVLSVTAAGRRGAEARMLDMFDVKVSTGTWAYNPATGKDEETFTFLFATKARVKSTRTYGNLNQQVGGRTATTVTREFHIPVGSPVIPLGAVAFCTAVDPTSDPTLLGARLRLAGAAPGSQTTARRMEVTETVS